MLKIKKLRNENENENENENGNEDEQFKKNKIIKEKIKSLNWFNKNKFKKILAITDSDRFTYKNKIGEFKYIDIKDLVNNIGNNTTSKTNAKKRLNTLGKRKMQK